MKISTRRIVFFLLYLTICYSLTSCTPERKLQRLLKKYPHLTTTEIITIRDTIRDTIRVEVPGVSKDTFFSVTSLKDTVYIDTNQLNVTIWERNDTIFVEANCETIIKNVPYEKIIIRKIPVQKIIYRKPRDWLRIVVFAFLAGFVSHYILQLVLNRKRQQNQIP